MIPFIKSIIQATQLDKHFCSHIGAQYVIIAVIDVVMHLRLLIYLALSSLTIMFLVDSLKVKLQRSRVLRSSEGYHNITIDKNNNMILSCWN